jgi:DNA-binding protein H-NS
MKLDTLVGLEDGELRAVAARCEELLAQHDRERKDKAMADAEARLAEVGLKLKDLVGGKSRARSGNGKRLIYHAGRQYQHPTNKALVWPGKGKKPSWLVSLEADGGKAVELGG